MDGIGISSRDRYEFYYSVHEESGRWIALVSDKDDEEIVCLGDDFQNEGDANKSCKLHLIEELIL